jgi:hypothetical protein
VPPPPAVPPASPPPRRPIVPSAKPRSAGSVGWPLGCGVLATLFLFAVLGWASAPECPTACTGGAKPFVYATVFVVPLVLLAAVSISLQRGKPRNGLIVISIFVFVLAELVWVVKAHGVDVLDIALCGPLGHEWPLSGVFQCADLPLDTQLIFFFVALSPSVFLAPLLIRRRKRSPSP